MRKTWSNQANQYRCCQSQLIAWSKRTCRVRRQNSSRIWVTTTLHYNTAHNWKQWNKINRRMETEKKCSNNFCSCRKTPARPEVMRLANGNDFLPTASIMGQFLHPSPSQEDYRFSMRILNKHTEPPFCHYGFCPAIHISPLFCQPQSCLPLLVISISKLCTHLHLPSTLPVHLSQQTLIPPFQHTLIPPFPDYIIP